MLKEYFYHTTIGFDIRLLGALVAAENEKIFLIQLFIWKIYFWQFMEQIPVVHVHLQVSN